jgi:hypothetical protein
MIRVDRPVVAVLYFLKLARAMVLWISLYVVEKVFQDAYVQRAMGGRDDGKPPSLASMIMYAVAIEGTVMLLIVAVLVLLMARYKNPRTTFVIDRQFMSLLAIDYAFTTVTMVGLGVLLAKQVQDGRLFRYRDDGLRGIRALSNLLLYVSMVVITLPFFRILG